MSTRMFKMKVNTEAGEVVILVKSKLAESITLVDTTEEGQIWVVMSWLPRMKLGSVYIPPSRSRSR